MSRFQHVAAKLLLPVCALCLLGLDFGRAQDAGSSPAKQGGTIASSVNIEVDGQVLAVHMAGGDVAEALKVAGVELGEEDECSPALSEAIAPNMMITVRRVCTRRWCSKADSCAHPGDSDAPAARGLPSSSTRRMV